jgi:hypothetical protein
MRMKGSAYYIQNYTHYLHTLNFNEENALISI